MGSLVPAVDVEETLGQADPGALGCSLEPDLVMGDKISAVATEDTGATKRITAGMRAGDEGAFTEFYESYCDRLYRYLLLLTRGNETVVRDMLQTTMTKVMQLTREFNDEAHLWNWLAAIARNNFFDSLRRTQHAPQIVPRLSEDCPGIPAVVDDSERMLADALDRSLLELDSDERALIEAFYFKDGSYQSVAEEQDTTPKAVESKLARVRQKLRAALFRKLRYENE